MAKIILDQRAAECAVYGGAVLGGGGGGWIEEGLMIGRLAVEVGQPELYTTDELADDDLIAAVSMVGAPGAADKFVKPVHYIKALRLLQEKLTRPLKGITTNENGAGTTVNGWFQAAVTELPILDCPCNGRAHPTGLMGSLNLTEQSDYVTYQAAVGGRADRYVEMSLSGSLDKAAAIIRQASVAAGGMIAVARNPVTVAYARENGAPGAVRYAMKVGEAWLSQRGQAAVNAVAAFLKGKVLAEGVVTDFSLAMENGFDVGKVRIEDKYEITFWNEYMTLEHHGERLATFPDLIMTFAAATGQPIVSAALAKGQQVMVLAVPRDNLILSKTMSNRNLLQTVEQVIHKPV